ncbi:MAG: hypothetical protein FIA91_06545 [Geobacter sp.]|nr:hypothetical protein [Geobacter sp.]
MKRAALAAVFTLMAVATAGADELQDTFDKVNRNLYGIETEKPAPERPRKKLPEIREEAPVRVEQEERADITWDFETGDLRGWTAEGEAFRYQPTYGDNPTARHRGQPSQHQGDYWIGGYERCQSPDCNAGAVQGDGPQGTLTSAPFSVDSPSISFLIGGGCDLAHERVEILVERRVVYKVTGKCTESMGRVSFDMSEFMGQTARIRLIDSSSGGWGHINFDAVRFE